MEHVVGLTGIGGQGVQLAARTLAEAAMRNGRRVQMFASYGGMMRGGNSDSYVVIADHAVTAPPMPGKVDAAIVLHHAYADELWARLRPDSTAIVNTSVVDLDALAPTTAATIELDALREAASVDAPLAASLVAVAVLAAHLELADEEALVATAPRVLPPYRSDAIEANQRALRHGFAVRSGSATAHG